MTYRSLFILTVFFLFASCSEHYHHGYKNDNDGNFNALWDIVNEHYCFFDEKNVDWDRIYTIYKPQADTIANSRSLFYLFAQMLDSLKDGHVNLYSEFDISRSKLWWQGYPSNFDESLIYSKRYLGDNYKIAGGLVYEKIAADSIGYIRYSSFNSDFSDANLVGVFSYFSDCKGLIIDVRNNGGGSIEYAKQLAASFIKGKPIIGYMQHKTGKGHNEFSDLEKMEIDSATTLVHWYRPVVVLTNRQSYSATNLFTNAMKHAFLCLIIGTKTGGGGGMPMSYELPCGWLLRLSTVRMFDSEKKSIEDGIQPDIEALICGDDKDDVIETAISAINELYNKAKQNND